jgi:hypothetical protein
VILFLDLQEVRLEKRRKAGDASILWKVQIPFGAFNTARDDPLRWGYFRFLKFFVFGIVDVLKACF